jgi:hypothetical protein
MYITCIKNMTCKVRKHYQKLKTAALICLYPVCHRHDTSSTSEIV